MATIHPGAVVSIGIAAAFIAWYFHGSINDPERLQIIHNVETAFALLFVFVTVAGLVLWITGRLDALSVLRFELPVEVVAAYEKLFGRFTPPAPGPR